MSQPERNAFEEIDVLLRAAKADYDRQSEPSEKRACFGGLLAALITLVNLHEPWRRAKIADLLGHLASAFLSLDAGAVPPLLVANKPKGAPAIPSWAVVRAYAAAAAAILMNEGGQTADTADEWVASRLDKAGYKKPRRAGSRQDGRLITRNTVKAWRKEAREAAHGNLMRNTYDGLIDTSSERWFTEPPFDRDDPPTEKAQQIMSTLVQVSPPWIY